MLVESLGINTNYNEPNIYVHKDYNYNHRVNDETQ